MAARLHPAPAPSEQIVDLRRISARELDPLLAEEITAWRSGIEWDFEKAADLVRRFMDLRALNGSALVQDGAVIGYVYYVLEENKGLIGDLFVRQPCRTVARENALLDSVLQPLMRNSQVSRIECQLMMLQAAAQRETPGARYLSAFGRNFMRLDLARAPLREGTVRRPAYMEKWSDHYQEGAAHLIAAAYGGHIDGQINDQYRSAAGARRFLYNIVQYPGCGIFHRPASFVAFTPAGPSGGERLCGISLASVVAPQCGHITQICVAPEVRGTGIGHALLRQSLLALREAGCQSASLTVTAGNQDAVALYERVGFHTIHRFSAYVWEGF